jgi:Surface antigen variable number repeat
LDQEALNLALQKVRSHYISRGYLDATAGAETRFKANLASIFIRVQPGAAYAVEGLEFSGTPTLSRSEIDPSQLPLKELCRCLIEKRAEAERSGVSDFGVDLLVRPAYPTGEFSTQQRVLLTAKTHAGPPYRVRTIEFRGNHRLSDLTLRKALVLSEGEWFDRGLLRRSLTRLTLTGLIHPVSEFDVEIQQNPVEHTVDLVVPVREKARGGWSLGGPAWRGLSQKAWFSIGSRLPNWGSPNLELPTYTFAFSLTYPLLSFPLTVLNPSYLSLGLARPYLPGQSWRSGFLISPQASWVQMLLTSSLSQIKPRLAERGELTPSLPVPLQWTTTSLDQPRVLTSGLLICEPLPKAGSRLLGYLQAASEWLFPTGF